LRICLLKVIEQGREREIVSAYNGRPAAKLVPMHAVPTGQRIGIAKANSRCRIATTHITTRSLECSRRALG